MPVSRELAKKLYDNINKGKVKLSQLTEEGQRVYLQYRRDNGLLPEDRLTEAGKAAVAKLHPFATYAPEITKENLPNVLKYDSNARLQAQSDDAKLGRTALKNNGLSYEVAPPAKPKKGKDLDWGADNAAMTVTKPKPQLKPGLRQITVSNKGVPVVVDTKKFENNSKIAGAAVAGLSDSVSLGIIPKALESFDPTMKEAYAQAQKDSPIAYGIGQGYGYLMGGSKLAGTKAVKTVVGKVGSKLGKQVVEGALVGGGMTAIEDTVKGKGLKQTAKDTGINMVLGAGADITLHGAGKLIQAIVKKYGNKITPEITKAIEQATTLEAKPNKTPQEVEDYYAMIEYLDEINRKSPEYIKKEARLNVPKAKEIKTALQDVKIQPTIASKGKLYSVKNTEYDKALQEYNDAIETIQNLYGTNELRASEYARIKQDTGIDIEQIVHRMEEAQPPSISRIGERERLKSAAGLKPLPDLAKVETVPQHVKPNRPILSALDAKINKPYDAPKPQLQRIEQPQIKQNSIGSINTPVVEKPLKTDFTAPVITDELANNPTYKEITDELKGSKVTPDDNIKAMAPTIKDKAGLTLNLKDMYRNMRDIFGKSYDYVKKNYIDPFDASKKAYTDEVKKYTDDIYNKVVKGLGINKGTKESAAVQWYGEGVKVIDGKEVSYAKEDLIKDFGQGKANKIMEADKVFRQAYNELIDKVNATRKTIYPNNPEKEVLKRSNYYRHFNEMAEGFKGLKNIFETPAMIDPKLAGMSEFTKPNSRWASFMQKRGNSGYTADAVGGFLNYVQPAAYSIHIDPHIKSFRSLAKDIAEATQDTKNANNTIKYLNDFANSLAGKTSKYDRVLQEDIPGGRMAFNVINWVNGRVKSNQVLMNAQSALSQFANVPVGVAKVKNPIALTKGAGQTLAGIVGKGNKAIAKSQFINERYIGDLLSRFDKKLTQQPKKFAAWLLEGADKLGTTFTWNSAYNKAIMNGIKDPVKYANDLTRSIVAGRGIGEVPLLQQAKTFQLVAPFQLEVSNLWQVLGDSVKEKDVAGIAMILLGNYLFNNATENLTGNRVTFDPVDAMIEALTEDDTNAGKVAGRMVGEVLSNVPLGQTLAAQYPEYGADISTPLGSLSLPSRKALFGDEDPTRFGGGLLVTKALTDPLYKVALPFGGAQAKKTIEGLQAVGKGMVAKNGKLSFPVENTTENKLKAGLFGKYATKEASEYFDQDRRPLSEKQTKELLRQPDLKKAYEKKMAERRIETLQDKIKAIRKDDTLSWTERQKKMAELQAQINTLKRSI